MKEKKKSVVAAQWENMVNFLRSGKPPISVSRSSRYLPRNSRSGHIPLKGGASRKFKPLEDEENPDE